MVNYQHIFRNLAPSDHRFTPESFTDLVGRELPVTIDDRTYLATVVATEVNDDGTEAEITVDLPDSTAPVLHVPMNSFGYVE